MSHERDLVRDSRHTVVPQRHAFLWVWNLSPWAGTPIAGAEHASELANLGFGMEPPAREFGLGREVATAIPRIDSQPGGPEHLRKGYEIEGSHGRRYGI